MEVLYLKIKWRKLYWNEIDYGISDNLSLRIETERNKAIGGDEYTETIEKQIGFIDDENDLNQTVRTLQFLQHPQITKIQWISQELIHWMIKI